MPIWLGIGRSAYLETYYNGCFSRIALETLNQEMRWLTHMASFKDERLVEYLVLVLLRHGQQVCAKPFVKAFAN